MPQKLSKDLKDFSQYMEEVETRLISTHFRRVSAISTGECKAMYAFLSEEVLPRMKVLEKRLGDYCLHGDYGHREISSLHSLYSQFAFLGIAMKQYVWLLRGGLTVDWSRPDLDPLSHVDVLLEFHAGECMRKIPQVQELIRKSELMK